MRAEIVRRDEEIAKLKARKKYGLVWDEKKTKEQFETDAENALPVLKAVAGKAISTDATKPDNILIEGDNYHALSVLNYTHQGKVDVIYIDPPYNTGAKDWKYNNDYVDKNDTYRHSKWLSFMKKRLILAHELLSESGFICITIDHYELFYLGALCDEIFDENNRLGIVTVVHNPKGRNLSKFFSENSEFVFVYAKNIQHAAFNAVAISDRVRETFTLKDKKGLYRLDDFMRARNERSRENRPAFWYPIYVSKDLNHITTEKIKDYYEVFPKTENGEFSWKTLPETFINRNIGGYFVAVIENENVVIKHKYREREIIKNVWTDKKYQSEFNGTQLLKKILGKNIFNYPKSLYAVIDFLKITARPNSIILDFFAGSGTTGHAVLQLNKEDNGNRQFILCTNNENNICTEVTYPRVSKVMRGYANSKKEKVAGLGGNLRYFRTDFVQKTGSRDDIKSKLTAKCTELLCLREGIFDEVHADKKGKYPAYRIFAHGNKAMAIFYTLGYTRLKQLKTALDKLPGEKILYCFTLDPMGLNADDFIDWRNVRLESIPQPILDMYEEIHVR